MRRLKQPLSQKYLKKIFWAKISWFFAWIRNFARLLYEKKILKMFFFIIIWFYVWNCVRLLHYPQFVCLMSRLKFVLTQTHESIWSHLDQEDLYHLSWVSGTFGVLESKTFCHSLKSKIYLVDDRRQRAPFDVKTHWSIAVYWLRVLKYFRSKNHKVIYKIYKDFELCKLFMHNFFALKCPNTSMI